MLQEITARQAKKPFEPFIIRLLDGRRLSVTSPGMVHARPSINAFLFDNEELGWPENLDASLIVGLVKAPRRARKRRGIR